MYCPPPDIKASGWPVIHLKTLVSVRDLTLCWLKKTIRSLSLAAIIFFLHLTVIFIMFTSLVSSQYIYICLKAWKCFKTYGICQSIANIGAFACLKLQCNVNGPLFEVYIWKCCKSVLWTRYKSHCSIQHFHHPHKL